jgi:hypothetical protein
MQRDGMRYHSRVISLADGSSTDHGTVGSSASLSRALNAMTSRDISVASFVQLAILESLLTRLPITERHEHGRHGQEPEPKP